jgi:hypothetical protein
LTGMSWLHFSENLIDPATECMNSLAGYTEPPVTTFAPR